MIDVPRIALAVGGGYLLGRTKKLRFAIIVGGAITGRKLPTSTGDLLRMGTRYVANSPELTPLRDAIRGQLLGAGRNAAIAAAGYQMEMLTAFLTARLELLEGYPPTLVAPIETDETEPVAIESATTPRMVVEPITVSVPDDIPEAQRLPRSPASGQGHLIEGAPA